MTWSSSEPLEEAVSFAALRDDAKQQNLETAALLFQLHLLRVKADTEELAHLFFLLPEEIRSRPHAVSFARALQGFFCFTPPPDLPRRDYSPTELLLLVLLLKEERIRISEPEARRLLGRINHYFRVVRCNEAHCADLLLLYEAIQYFDHDPDILTALYEKVLAHRLHLLTGLDLPSVTDLLLLLGPVYDEKLGNPAQGAALLRRCIQMRAERYRPESNLMLVPQYELMGVLQRMGAEKEAIALSEEILGQPETEDNRLLLCSACLLRADIHLDRLETSGVGEDLHTAQALYGRMDPSYDADFSLSFHLHTSFVRYYFLNTADPTDLNRLEYHAQQAYALTKRHDLGAENTLVAINNLIFPLSYSARLDEAAALLQEGVELIAREKLEHSRIAAVLYASAALVDMEELLPPQARQAAGAVRDESGDPVLSFWLLFHRALSLLKPRFLLPGKLIEVRGLVIRCERLLGRFCREVNTASISLKRLRALLFLRQGNREASRFWTFSALDDARAHPHLHPMGTLLNISMAFFPTLPDILTGPELKALLDELCAEMPERIRRILAHRDESYILQALWSNTILINLTLALAEQGVISCRVEELYTLVINGKSIYSRLLRLNRQMRADNPQDEPIYRQIDELRKDILSEKASEMLRGQGWDVSHLEQEKRLLELSLEEEVPHSFHWFTCEEILDRLPDHAILVDYYAYPSNRSGELMLPDMRYAVFVSFHQNGQRKVCRLPSLNFLDVRWNLLLVTAEARASRLRTLARGLGTVGHDTLYRLLFQPVYPLLDPSVTTLFFSPDGELTRLPFGLLALFPGRRLCDRYTIVYLESARDLKPDTRIRLEGQEALVLGNPDFSLTPVDPESVPPILTHRLVTKIPLTKIEAQMVADKLGAVPLLRRAACKSALQDCTAAILHIATHGAFYFDPDDEDDHSAQYESLSAPLRRACLYFSGANDWLLTGREDPALGNGVLTAEELCHYRMKPPELVVLSACFSGMGDAQQGNGIVGLQTAFKVQGAKVMLLSIWEADDFAAAILMDRFYDNLSSMPAGQALREAQHYVRSVTIAQLGDRQWFNERRFRRIGLVAEDMRKMAQRPPNWKPFSHIRYWGGYMLYE